MTNESNLWALSWDPRSHNFHIEPVWKLIERNREAFEQGRVPHYHVLLISTDKEELHREADAQRPLLQARDAIKRAADRPDPMS